MVYPTLFQKIFFPFQIPFVAPQKWKLFNEWVGYLKTLKPKWKRRC